MADSVISFVVGNLLNVAKTEIASMIGIRKELETLHSEFSAIQRVLQDAEIRQIKDHSVKDWLQKLKSVAYDVDDILDEWRIKCRSSNVEVSNSFSPLVSCLLHPKQCLKFVYRVKDVKERLKQIATEKERYHFRELPGREKRNIDRNTYSYVEESSVIGRDEDKQIIIKKLVDQNLVCGEEHVPTMSIVGMGGLGKTTLAQYVYNAQKVEECFEKRVWVCVSEDFNVEVIMRNIVENGGGSCSGVTQVEALQQKLVELLGGKKYLLVLDDVWNQAWLKWEPLQRILNRGANGSRIVITARSRGVANAVRSVYTHDLELLSRDNCLKIFKSIAFEGGSDQDYEEVEDIGIKIVEKCKGLPLAVKTVASAVRSRRPTKEQWEGILNSEIWDLPMSEEVGILPALMLSYTELPLGLKICFSYCSLFQKDTVLRTDLLINLWAAQGYIKNDRPEEVEATGQEYISELLDRSLLQEPKKVVDGTKIIFCKMHDLVHDLAKWVAHGECRAITECKLLSDGDARHCLIFEDVSREKHITWAGFQNLRTLIIDPSSPRVHVQIGMIKHLLRVRTLSLSGDLGIDRLPRNPRSPRVHVQIGMIKHLQRVRTLSLSGDLGIDRLPGLGSLVQLRYLDLSATGIRYVPRSIGNLKELRYLDLSSTRIKILPITLASLPHLHTLNVRHCFQLYRKTPRNRWDRPFPRFISEMKSLAHLHAESFVENVENWT